MKRNIIAIGGGKIMVPTNREPQTSLIDQSIVQQVKRKSPKVLFIPTLVKTMWIIVKLSVTSMKNA